jgi:phosphohistidine phosphatase
MQVILVHHGDAVGPGVDPQRPLSALGRQQAEWLADRVRAAGFTPAVIWHSGKLRARQTAEPFLRACNPMAEFRMVRGLGPDDPPDWMRDELNRETRDALIVGHMPSVAALARRLCPVAGDFPQNGLIAFGRSDEGDWTELWRASPPSVPVVPFDQDRRR